MNVKYKNTKYKVNFKNALKIRWRQALLLARRLKRILLRMLEVFKKDLIVLLIAIIGYVLFVVIIQNMCTECSILESIWSTRAEVFTVFGVVALNAFISYERGWRKSIREWYWVYSKYLMKFEFCIIELNSALRIENNGFILRTNESFKDFQQSFENMLSSKNEIDKIGLQKVLTRINNECLELKNMVNKDEYFQYKSNFNSIQEMFQEYIVYLSNRISYDEQDISYVDLLRVYEYMYEIIAITRRLWRTEINLDNEIMEILKCSGYNVSGF